MRIVIDLQACQSASRERGIGRYSFDLARAIAAAPGSHEIWLALSAAFPSSIATLRHAFSDVLPRERIAVFATPAPAAALDTRNAWRDHVGEPMRETFLHRLRPDIVHVSSLFEGLVDNAVTSVGAVTLPHATATTFYDLIPLSTGESLPTPASVNWYQRKLTSLRRSDVLLALSEHARDEAVALLPMPSDRVTVISSAASSIFRPGALDAEAATALRQRLGIARPFVLHAAGFDARKNVGNLISAYARLPDALRDEHQLVLAGGVDIEERERLRLLSEREGLNFLDVIFTGRLTDRELAALYGQCALFILPSFQEGFGLPALEAMACGAPVLGSDATSIPEVIGRRDALFDPADADAMAAKMHAVLSDRAFEMELRRHGLQRAAEFSWSATARRALDAMEESARRLRHERETAATVSDAPRPRPKLAYVSPLPPERTGIAIYSAELLPYLIEHYDVELVVQQANVELPADLSTLPVRTADWLVANAARMPRVLYHMGNSPAHQWMFALIGQVPGTVVLHDFFLGGVLNWMDAAWITPGSFRARLFEAHGYAALLQDSPEERAATIDRFPCNHIVVDEANGIIVHSDEALRLARAHDGDIGDQWCRIPQLRRLADTGNRAASRRALAIDDDAFVTCCFGFLDPAKLDDRLLSAWLASTLAQDPRHRLVFVGENHGGDYGRRLLQTIEHSPSGARIRITGFVDDASYRHYLDSADLAVQLRGVSRGESPRTALDCLAHGLPLIVNAGSSLAALPEHVVIRLPAGFTDEDLVAALERASADADLRARLAQAGRDHLADEHDPARIARRFRDAIERFAVDGRRRRYEDLVARIAADTTKPAPSREDWTATAASIAFNLPTPRLPQLLVDVSVLARQDLRTGIERVTRAVLRRLLEHPPAGYRIEPVVTRRDRYVYARKFTCEWLGLTDTMPDGVPIEVAPGDVFLGLDWAADLVPASQDALARYRALGLRVTFVVYDLLPLSHPQFYPPGIDEMQRTWVDSIAQVADGLVCISDAVARELLGFLQSSGPARDTPLEVGHFRLGADIERSVPTAGGTSQHAALLTRMRSIPAAIMVGTVEPRKGHRQVVAAFDALWRDGVELDLVIIGKKGWMVDELAATIVAHPEYGRRLHWLQDANDTVLEEAYARARVLVAASMGEGFGLPLIEAARRGVPIIARDLPVFREVAGDASFYFEGEEPSALAAAVAEWVALHREDRHPRPDGIPLVTWAQSTDELLQVVLGGRWQRTWDGKTMTPPVAPRDDHDVRPQPTRMTMREAESRPCRAASDETSMNAPDRTHLDTPQSLRRSDGPASSGSVPEEAKAVAPTRDPGPDIAFALPPMHPPQPAFEVKSRGYHVEDFAQLQHADFVRAAFRGLLQREPDAEGLAHYLSRLERGDSKYLIVGLIRYSAEGRKAAIPVQGLRGRYLVERAARVPIVGPVIRVILDIAALPSLARRARRDEARVAQQLATLREHVAAGHRATQASTEAMAQSQREVLARVDGSVVVTTRLKAALGAIDQRVSGVTTRVRRFEDEAVAEAAQQRAFETVYDQFEDRFRGTREDIKGRVAVYVPRLLAAGIGAADMPVLDIGCGRGEWLEVLQERGLHARGIDANPRMVMRCREVGLDVAEGDGLAALSTMPAASLGAVTGLHIVEHLPPAYLLSLLKQAARALRPGGLAIFETPNCENVGVGSHSFYFDPTHRNPLPPPTLAFLVEAAGLQVAEVLKLHPSTDADRFRATDPAVEAFINDHFDGPRDYAVVGRKI